MSGPASRRQVQSPSAGVNSAGAFTASELVDHRSEKAFADFLAANRRYAAAEGSNEASDALWVEVEGAQDEIDALPPSADAAAAFVLMQLTCELGQDQSLFDPDGGRFNLKYVLWSILRFVRPALSGDIARFTADLLDHPDRPARDSLLLRAIDERLTIPGSLPSR